MIPTGYKSKLSHQLSYPVRAGEISSALADVPQLEALTVAFFASPIAPGARFRQVLRERMPYTVFRAEFHPARKPGLSAAEFMIERGWYDERWKLTVYAVLREFRQAANRLLLDQGFPALNLWLKAERDPRGMIAERMELVFNPAEQSLTTTVVVQFNSSRV